MGLFLDPFWIRRSVLDPLRTPSEPQEASGAGSMGPFWDPFWIRSSDRAQSARIFVAFGDVFEARSDRVQLSLGSAGGVLSSLLVQFSEPDLSAYSSR